MGTFSAAFSSGIGGKVSLRLQMSLVSQNIPQNSSVISWSVFAVQSAPTYSWCAYADAVATVNINGAQVFNGKWNGTGNWDFRNLGAGASVPIASGTMTVGHNPDGQKHVAFSVTASDAQFPLGSASMSGNDTTVLPRIPRASAFTVTSSVPADGVSVATVTITPADPSFKHAVWWKMGTAAILHNDIDTSTSLTIPTAWNVFIPNATSGTATVTVETWGPGGFITSGTKNFTVTVPNTATYAPNFTASGTQQQHASLSGVALYIQGYTGVKVIATSPTPGTGATLSSWSITGPDGTATGTFPTNGGLTIPALRTAGAQTYTVKVVDSRGRSTTKDFTLTVTAYSPPTITAADAFRSNSAGTALDDGLYIRAQATAGWTNFTGNTITNTLRWKRSDLSTWAGSVSFTSGTAVTVGAGAILADYAWDVQWESKDRLNTTILTYSIGPAAYLMSMDANAGSVAIGGPADTTKTFKVYPPATFEGNLSVRAPGSIREGGLGLERLYGAGFKAYNFGNGYLIQTDIGPTEDAMVLLDIEFNTYASAATVGTGTIQVQAYSYGSSSAIGQTAATSTVGRRDVYAFFYSNTLHFWLPGGPYETALIRLATQLGTTSGNHRLINVTNAAMPTSGTARSVVIVPEVLGYKPQAHATFTYSGGSTAAGASRVLATGTITLTKPSMVFFSGNFQAITTGNAAAWFDVEVVGADIYPFRIHSYNKAIHTMAAWSRGFNVAAAGTYTVRVVARVDPGAGAMQFEDIHAEVWTF